MFPAVTRRNLFSLGLQDLCSRAEPLLLAGQGAGGAVLLPGPFGVRDSK